MPKLTHKIKHTSKQAKAFIAEVARRYRDDETSLAASSLAYTALLSLVPFMSVLVTVFSAMPLFENASQTLQDFIFHNFVPATGEVIQDYIAQFVSKARGLTVSMSLAVFVTSILMMHTMEKALNRTFDCKPSGSLIKKVTLYWTALTLGPLLIGGGIAMSSIIFKFSALASTKTMLLKALPILSSAAGFFVIYLFVPNRKINWRYALIGALFAAICFELAKKGFALYVTTVPSYQKIYGALASIPLFLIWTFLSWNIILIGGTITATLESSRWRSHVQHYHKNQRFLLILELLNLLWKASQDGRTIDHEALTQKLYFVPDDELAEQLSWLSDNNLMAINQDGAYLLRQDLDQLKLKDLYRKGEFKLPLKAEIYFQKHQAVLDECWSTVDNLFNQPIALFFKK
ncbi:YihY family inner membrane protein [Marinicella rhabdoformis]|uniref:YihY family inner membrane protein n=1 Tax=Marinicella rhabdoformis TaxID=2580566 RepID=UPI0012AEB713|nr:YihY family inner membrane protein [Marinicella rhabdoformis]